MMGWILSDCEPVQMVSSLSCFCWLLPCHSSEKSSEHNQQPVLSGVEPLVLLGMCVCVCVCVYGRRVLPLADCAKVFP